MDPETTVVEANAAFTKHLYETLARKKGNVFFSPVSVHAVLCMLQQGAGGETAHALAAALKTPDVVAAEGYEAAIRRMNGFKQIELLLANKIYGTEIQFKKEFEEKIRHSFDGEVEVLDRKDARKAAGVVNKWVEEKTHSHIKNIVNESVFKDTFSLLLVNAIYFKGEWVSKFKEAATKKGKFWVDEKHSIEVDLMHQKESYWYKEDEELGAQVIEMPYKGYDVKMIIVLPSDHNIDKVEAKLSQMDIGALGKDMKHVDVHLFLPKFKMEETIQLNDVLSQMGLKSIFDMNKANFKGMLDASSLKDNLFVSEVIQKAFIEVNEGGTVAAAATRAAMVLGCAPGAPKPAIFKVDRPAIFLLVSSHGKDKTPNVLFYGRLCHPKF